ncbi:uncharacterized protein LOC119402711 [Rhipicephalus sanguineus]|uniref:uncharacterized protein LOC119402711 n=1 Tax=Rhipicephalus sanguineus TaxID=34632 RepID=UPI0020C29A5F|nr:uncharacterized protein LOC119402711 [Rhipicephalus sanguineus]
MATAPTSPLTLHERLASALRQPGGHSVCAMIESSGIKYACVMTADPGRETAEHDMICFWFTPSLPYFYVYPASPKSKFIATLHHLLRGNPAQQPGDYLGELRFAFSGVPGLLGDVAASRNINAWDDPGIASMIPFQTDRSVERRQLAREEPTRTPPSSVASSPSGVNVVKVITEQMTEEIRRLENRWFQRLPMGRAAESSVLVEGSSSGRLHSQHGLAASFVDAAQASAPTSSSRAFPRNAQAGLRGKPYAT